MERALSRMPKRTDIEIHPARSAPARSSSARRASSTTPAPQACKALKEEGYRVVLVNSNPATIMTDPEFADRTYVEPLTVDDRRAQSSQRERPDALLPTIGGQTGLNLAIELAERACSSATACELIGAKIDAIKQAEDRDLFKAAMQRIGLDGAAQRHRPLRIGRRARLRREIGLPLIIRPSRTLGGTGGRASPTTDEELRSAMPPAGLDASPIHEILVEESIAGWKEFELEVMRDRKDNVVIVCSIENFDPMGVHTGDSHHGRAGADADRQGIPAHARRRRSRSSARSASTPAARTSSSPSIPTNGRLVVIEMNPRVSRSSALAVKATGFPIAKIAAKLAVGYTLDEIRNDITRETPACFEPTIDYVVTKIPRFTFEKFPQADDVARPRR